MNVNGLIAAAGLLLIGCPSSPPSSQDWQADSDSHLAETTCLGTGCTPVHPECPPPGPYGYDKGSTLVNLEFQDVDGNQVELHDLCGAPVALIYHFYGW